MSSSSWATGEGLVWLIGEFGAVSRMYVVLYLGSYRMLSRAMDGRIMCRGIISSYQSVGI